MMQENMEPLEVADLLGRNVKEVIRLASRGYLPGRKVGDQWRFSRTEITHWIEDQLHAYTEEELTRLEGPPLHKGAEALLSLYLPLSCVAVPLQSRSKPGLLRELVELAEQSGHVYQPEAILAAIEQRESLASTALPVGVAFPHPHRPLPQSLGDSVVAFGRSLSGIPFGSERGALTDLFFLVCGQDSAIHLRLLARLSRLLLIPGFLDELRLRETPKEAHRFIITSEADLIGE